MVERISLGLEYSGGVPMPLVSDAGKFAVAAVDSFGDPTLVYQTQTAAVADDAFATPLAPHLRGLGLTVDASGNLAYRPRPRQVVIQDWFISGPGSGTTGLGASGWNLLGNGTPAYARVNNNFSLAGCAEVSTSGTINDRASLVLGDTESREIINASQVGILQFGVLLPATTTRRVFVGILEDYSSDPLAAAECLGFSYDSAASANWRVISRVGSVGSPFDTGVAAGTGAVLFTIWQVSSGVFTFHISNTQVHSISGGLPTLGLNVGMRVQTLAGSAASARIGYFGLESAPLTGALDDDSFLEA